MCSLGLHVMFAHKVLDTSSVTTRTSVCTSCSTQGLASSHTHTTPSDERDTQRFVFRNEPCLKTHSAMDCPQSAHSINARALSLWFPKCLAPLPLQLIYCLADDAGAADR